MQNSGRSTAHRPNKSTSGLNGVSPKEKTNYYWDTSLGYDHGVGINNVGEKRVLLLL